MVLILLLGAGLLASDGWGRGYGWGMMGLVIGGVVWFDQSLSREGSRPGTGRMVGETPLEILKRRYKRRYASGEVTKEQFEEIRRTLDS